MGLYWYQLYQTHILGYRKLPNKMLKSVGKRNGIFQLLKGNYPQWLVRKKEEKLQRECYGVTYNTFLCIGQQQEICQCSAALWFARAIRTLCKQ